MCLVKHTPSCIEKGTILLFSYAILLRCKSYCKLTLNTMSGKILIKVG